MELTLEDIEDWPETTISHEQLSGLEITDANIYAWRKRGIAVCLNPTSVKNHRIYYAAPIKTFLLKKTKNK